jgi:hypothetical protein
VFARTRVRVRVTKVDVITKAVTIEDSMHHLLLKTLSYILKGLHYSYFCK